MTAIRNPARPRPQATGDASAHNATNAGVAVVGASFFWPALFALDLSGLREDRCGARRLSPANVDAARLQLTPTPKPPPLGRGLFLKERHMEVLLPVIVLLIVYTGIKFLIRLPIRAREMRENERRLADQECLQAHREMLARPITTARDLIHNDLSAMQDKEGHGGY